MNAPIAVIPARDEVRRLPAALAALRAQGVEAVVVANGCDDATAALARALGAQVIETPALPGGVGEARAIGLAAAARLRPAWLMTTDADCTLRPGAVAAIAQALEAADAVFGRVEPDPAEFALLPRAVRRHGDLEDRRDALVAWIEGRLAPLPWNPMPCHGQSPGALIAWRPEAYAASGGIEPVRCHEDRRMAAALVRAGCRVARPWAAAVRASCRLAGRAPGGMAGTIAARARADLRPETLRLGAECAALARRLHTLTHTHIPEGDRDVPPLVQAAI